MLSDILKQNPSLDEALEIYFEDMDEYLQPHFTWIKVPNNSEQAKLSIDKLLDNYQVYETKFFIFDDQHILLVVDSEINEIKRLTKDIREHCLLSYESTEVASFRHNCIGNVWRCLDFSMQLLEQTIADSNSGTDKAINDFLDQDNWPGLSQFTRSS